MSELVKANKTASNLIASREDMPRHILEPMQRLEAVQANRLFLERVKGTMMENVHYGTFVGVSQPSLYQPGAELLAMSFDLVVDYDINCINNENGHREYVIKATLTDYVTGKVRGHGSGLCSTMEPKYRYRYGKHECPSCGETGTIKRSKYPDKKTREKGWYCHSAGGGCGAEFDSKEPEIINQKPGKIENADLAEVYHTVLMMAQKRAYVKAVRTVTGASVFFTQDLEDMDFHEIPVTGDVKKLIVSEAVQDAPDVNQGEEKVKTPKTPKTPRAYGVTLSKLYEKVEDWIDGFSTGSASLEELEGKHGEALEWVEQWEDAAQRAKAKETLSLFVSRVAVMIGADDEKEVDGMIDGPGDPAVFDDQGLAK